MRVATAILLLAACSSPPPAAAALASAGSSTDALSPFLPADYQGELFTDYAALRDSGLLDRLERIPMLSPMLEVIARGYGRDLDALQRVRTAVVYDPQGTGRSMRTVSVVECDPAAKPLAMPAGWEPYERAGLDGYQCRSGAYAALLLHPTPGLVVAGERDLLEPLLTGSSKAGGPHPELRPFLAGEHVLFQYAAGTFGRRADQLTGSVGFFGYDDPADPCEFLRLRLAADAQRRLVLSITMRYRRGSPNLRRSEVDMRAFLDRTMAEPQVAGLKPLLQQVVVSHGERDLDLSLQLGEPADAIRSVERAVLALAALRSGPGKR
jgi:hypothetical protein